MLLLLLLSALSALLARAYFVRGSTPVVAGLVLLLSFPITWLLLNQGLEQHVRKYRMEFSAVKFLLGPDRKAQISNAELFFRWCLLHSALVGGLAFSGILAIRWWRGGRPEAHSIDSGLSDSIHAVSGLLGAEIQAPAVSAGQGKRVALRVYVHQWNFLHQHSEALGQPISNIVHSVVLYFGRQFDTSEKSRVAVQTYLDQSQAGSNLSLASHPIEIILAPEASRVIAELDPGFRHSDSRVVRKLLEIFMKIAEEEASSC
jgi:hypothetical protein